MRIRLVQPHELDSVAMLAVKAFNEDPTYAHFYPFRKVYPLDFYQGFRDSLEDILYRHEGAVVVAELDHHVKGGLKEMPFVIGYMVLLGNGIERSMVKWFPGVVENWRIGRGRAQPQRAYNRAQSPEAIKSYFDQAIPMFGPLAGTLECRTIAVLPEYQRGGYGRKMVQWLLDKGNELGLSVVGDAAVGGKGLPLYQQMGFRSMGEMELPYQKHSVKGFGEIEVQPLKVHVLRSFPDAKQAAKL